jgi:hypothetical protein
MSDVKIKQLDPSQIRYTPEENEIIQNLEGEYLIWKDGQWNKINIEGSDISMGLYDMNKQIISQLPDLTEEQIDDKKYAVSALHAKYGNEYYMLYGKEISYFTLFKIKDATYFANDVVDCLSNVGSAKSIDLTEDEDAVEIWVGIDNEVSCLYLFPYDSGLVEVGE